jgi:hypothetical protein
MHQDQQRPAAAIETADQPTQLTTNIENGDASGANSEEKVKVEQVIFSQGLVIASFRTKRANERDRVTIKIFSIFDHRDEHMKKPSIDLNAQHFIYSQKYMSAINFLKVPMLDWDDRRIEYQIASEIYRNSIDPNGPPL